MKIRSLRIRSEEKDKEIERLRAELKREEYQSMTHQGQRNNLASMMDKERKRVEELEEALRAIARVSPDSALPLHHCQQIASKALSGSEELKQ
jgi:predicted RNase H-like nuclease (RuvC/YqgF family)